MADMFDINELTDFGESLVKLANEKMPKESKKFIKNEANKGLILWKMQGKHLKVNITMMLKIL